MFRYISLLLHFLKYFPHIVVYLLTPHKAIIDYEIYAWNNHLSQKQRKGIIAVVHLLASLPEFRSLFYFRTGAEWLNFFAKGQNNLEFYTPSDKIGKGLMIWHGFSTVINVESMGDNCQIWQNVTIGKKNTSADRNRPTIGNDVKITSGAIVIGDILLGDNCTIGAGAIATNDIPSKATVVNQPSRIIL